MIGHPIYSHITTGDDVRAFMRGHVFCVWDFQSLIKALQSRLTCVTVPWLPTDDPAARRLINEIVLDEESDEVGPGQYASHFELYLAAMRDCGADVGPIDRLIAGLRQGKDLEAALAQARVAGPAAAFVRRTIALTRSAELHRICADFAFGREDVIPDMFQRVIAGLATQDPERFAKFRFYLVRHVEADGEVHGPLSRRLLERLCGNDELKWKQAEETARAALQARIDLWDYLVESLPSYSAARTGISG